MKAKLWVILGLIALPVVTTLAYHVPGHRPDIQGGVRNQIDNMAGSIKKNPDLTAKVEAKLEADSMLKKYITFKRIAITSYMNGHVKLTGQVAEQTEKDKATELTKAVEGVTDVTNDILIGRSLLK